MKEPNYTDVEKQVIKNRINQIEGKGGEIFRFSLWFLDMMVPLARFKDPDFRDRYLAKHPKVAAKYTEYRNLVKECMDLKQALREMK